MAYLQGLWQQSAVLAPAQPARVAKNLPLGNAHTRLVRLVVALVDKLHGMGGHHRKLQPRSQRDGPRNVGLIVRTARPLHLHIEAVRKYLRQPQRDIARQRRVALHQRLADRARLRTCQQNQPL